MLNLIAVTRSVAHVTPLFGQQRHIGNWSFRVFAMPSSLCLRSAIVGGGGMLISPGTAGDVLVCEARGTSTSTSADGGAVTMGSSGASSEPPRVPGA